MKPYPEQEKELQYSCYIPGVQKHFKTIGLSKAQYKYISNQIE